MRKFQYHQVDLSILDGDEMHLGYDKEWLYSLNEYGESGWEIIEAAYERRYNSGHSWYVMSVLLKREITGLSVEEIKRLSIVCSKSELSQTIPTKRNKKAK